MVEDETGLGVPDAELLRRGDKVRILHHQPKDFTQEARFTEKEFEVAIPAYFICPSWPLSSPYFLPHLFVPFSILSFKLRTT